MEQKNPQTTSVLPQANGTQLYPQLPSMMYQQPMINTSMYPQLNGNQMYPQQANMMYPQPMINTKDPAGPQAYYPNNPNMAFAGPAIMPAPVVLPKSGFDILNEQSDIMINQKMQWLEVVSGCEVENRYHVYGYDPATQQKKAKLFKCKEKSGWCSRQCLSGSCRPFKMNISSIKPTGELEPFIQMERPCTCTFLCFNRPEVHVNLVENGRTEYLGKVVDPFKCCSMEVDTSDHENEKKFRIHGSCCQLGTFCPCPCDPCQTFNFDVKSATTGENLSQMQKKSKGCIEAHYTDADNFNLNFPKNVTAGDKVMLMCAVVFLDFRHFERRPKKRN